MKRIISNKKPNQKLLQAGVLVGVAKGSLGHFPERTVQVKFLDLFPDRRRRVQIDAITTLGIAMEERPNNIKKLRLVCLGNYCDHLKIEIGGCIVWIYERFQLLQPFLIVEEF